MHRKRIVWLIDLALCIGLYICCESWITFYLCVVVLFLPLLSLLCSLPLVSRKKVRESHPARVLRGKDPSVSFRIGGNGNNPLPCNVSVSIKDMMGGAQRTEDLTLYCGDSLPLKFDTCHCGRFEIKVSRAVFSDFLGFFAFRARCPETFCVSVDPIPVRPDPEPDFSRFISRRYFPRRGGGFSENHELKEYTPGDPINNIHWKLSTKSDKIILREPQDREQDKIYLTLDRVTDRTEMDLALGCLVWVGGELLSRDVSFIVCCILDRENGSISERTVSAPEDLTALLDEIMSDKPFLGAESLAKYDIPGATWRFHVNPRKEEADG